MATTQGGRPRRISTFDQFVKFSTDASGLERTFRLLQSIVQILASIEPARQLLLSLILFISPFLSIPINTTSSKPLTPTLPHLLLSPPTLTALRTKFALGRRFFRVFRFLDSLSSAHKLYTTPATPTTAQGGGLDLETYLEIAARSFNGLYLLLETLHFPEVLLESTGASVWGAEMANTLHVEGQRFWFLALVCGVLGGVVKVVNLCAYRAVPGEGSGQVLGMEAAGGGGVGEDGGKGEKQEEDKGGRKKRKEEQARRQREEYQNKSRRVLRRLAADVMDLALPGTVVGWVRASSGTVGVLMLGSTLLTGLEVWERCGGE